MCIASCMLTHSHKRHQSYYYNNHFLSMQKHVVISCVMVYRHFLQALYLFLFSNVFKFIWLIFYILAYTYLKRLSYQSDITTIKYNRLTSKFGKCVYDMQKIVHEKALTLTTFRGAGIVRVKPIAQFLL